MSRLTRGFGRVARISTALLALAGCRKHEAPPATALALKLASETVANVQRGERHPYPLPYRVFVPRGYVATLRYPLIVYLHHGGNRGDDNLGQLNEEFESLVSAEVQAIEPCFVLAPQCPVSDQWVNAARTAPYQNYSQAQVPESEAAKLTLEIVQAVRGQYSIDPDRIYLTGSSMGASGTWDYITRYPGVFAAAMPVNGINDPSRASAIGALPIWAFHGARDEVSPVGNTRAMVAALRQLGSPIRYTELAGAGHDCGGAAYGNLEAIRWLLKQTKGSPSVGGDQRLR